MATKINRSRASRISDKQLKLFPHETLLIWRKRHELNQSQAAKEFRCSLFQFKLAEYGKPMEGFFYPREILKLAPHEKCLIYRKRAKLKQSEVAKKLGICRDWLRQQESGKIPCDKLLAHWEQS
jgi:predicted XRE-type DNA-binding protein